MLPRMTMTGIACTCGAHSHSNIQATAWSSHLATTIHCNGLHLQGLLEGGVGEEDFIDLEVGAIQGELAPQGHSGGHQYCIALSGGCMGALSSSRCLPT